MTITRWTMMDSEDTLAPRDGASDRLDVWSIVLEIEIHQEVRSV